MKLSQNAAVFAILLPGSAQAFQPPRPSSVKTTQHLSLFRKKRGDSTNDWSSLQGAPRTRNHDYANSRTAQESEDHVVSVASLMDGFDGAIFMAYEKMLVEVSQNVNDLLAQIQVRKTERIERAKQDYEMQLAKATTEAKRDLASVTAKNSKPINRAMKLYEQELAALSSGEGEGVQKDGGMAAYQAQMSAAIEKVKQDLAAASQNRATYMGNAMAAYEKQLAAATAKAEEEVALAAAKKDKWVANAIESYEKQLLAATSTSSNDHSSSHDNAGMETYEAQMNAAVSKAREMVTSDFDQRVGRIFRTKEYHASLSSSNTGGMMMGTKGASSSTVQEDDSYKGMLAYQEQLEEATKLAKEAEDSLEAGRLFQLDAFHDSLNKIHNVQSPTLMLQTIFQDTGLSSDDESSHGDYDEAGESEYAKQLITTAKKPAYGESFKASDPNEEYDEAGESEYAKQLITTAKTSAATNGASFKPSDPNDDDAGESAYAQQLITTAKKSTTSGAPIHEAAAPHWQDEAGESMYEQQFKTTAKKPTSYGGSW